MVSGWLVWDRLKEKWLFPLYRKAEQHITGQRIAGISRRDVQHAAGNHWSHAIDGSAARFHSIDRFKILSRIEIPDGRARFGFISADVSVPRSQKRDSGNHGHWRGLGGAASRSGDAGRFRSRRGPNFLTCCEFKSNEASADFGFSADEARNSDVREP